MFVKRPSPVESVEAPYHVVDVVLHVDPTTVVHELGTPQNLCQASAMFKTRMLHSMKSLICSWFMIHDGILNWWLSTVPISWNEVDIFFFKKVEKWWNMACCPLWLLWLKKIIPPESRWFSLIAHVVVNITIAGLQKYLLRVVPFI